MPITCYAARIFFFLCFPFFGLSGLRLKLGSIFGFEVHLLGDGHPSQGLMVALPSIYCTNVKSVG